MNISKTPIKIRTGSLDNTIRRARKPFKCAYDRGSPTVGIVGNRSTPGDLCVARNAGRRGASCNRKDRQVTFVHYVS
jgi:hypothetical protein